MKINRRRLSTDALDEFDVVSAVSAKYVNVKKYMDFVLKFLLGYLKLI